MFPDPGIYVDWDYNDPRLKKIRMECEPKMNRFSWIPKFFKMESLFHKCIEVVLRNEGGYVNHPSDPGGETKYGICKKYFPNEDIKNLTRIRAINLYYRYFWKPMHLDGINSEPLVLHIFDHGINAGKSTSIKMIQKLVGTIEDGVCGPITKGKINSFENIVKIEQDGTRITYTLLDLFKQARKSYYIDLANRKPELKVFLTGWLNRVERTSF